jgi:hypothetical protein
MKIILFYNSNFKELNLSRYCVEFYVVPSVFIKSEKQKLNMQLFY